MKTAELELERAEAAASDEACVLALARAWAAFPSSLIAHAAVTLGRSLPAQAIEAESQHEREERWHELAAGADPRELPRLLATPWTRRPKDAVRRLEKLAAFPRDPRIVDHLLELDTGERFLTPAGAQFWKDAWKLMLEWGSVDAARRLPREAPLHAVMPWEATRWVRIFEDVVHAWRDRLPQEPVLTEAMVATFTRLGDRVHAVERDVRALQASVYSTPEDDGPRLVLADALTERGDRRGDFIALQFAHERGELTPVKRQQMESLLAAAGRRWFDGLLGEVSSRAVFRKGFLDEVQLATRDPDPSARAWRLVEGLDCAGLAVPLGAFLRHDNLSRVRRLYHLRSETFINLLREGRGLAFELVELRPPLVRQLPTLAGRIETLRVRGELATAIDWFLPLELAHHVRRLELDAPEVREAGALEALLGRLESRGLAVQRVCLCADGGAWPRPWGGDWEVHLSRGDDGKLSIMEVTINGRATGLEAVLEPMAGTRLRSLSVSGTRYVPPAERAALEAIFQPLVKRQTRLAQFSSNLKVVRRGPLPPVVYDGR